MQPAAGSASNTAAGGTTYGPAGPQTSAGEYRSNQRNISKCVLIFIDKYKYEADLKAAVLNALETSKTPLCRLAGKISLGFCSFLVSCFSNKLEGNGEVKSWFACSLPRGSSSARAFLLILWGLFCRSDFAEPTQIGERVPLLPLRVFC